MNNFDFPKRKHGKPCLPPERPMPCPPHHHYVDTCPPPPPPGPCPPLPGPRPPHHHGPCPPPPPCGYVIHHFNKVCFKNYDEAVGILKNKDLLPGEEAFAYYFDKTAEYGINAISAVGNIKVGGANIIFDNADKVNITLDNLIDNVSINNEKMESFQNYIDSILDKIDKIDEFIDNKNEEDASNSSLQNNVALQLKLLKETDTSIIARIDVIDNLILTVKKDISDHQAEYTLLNASVLANTLKLESIDFIASDISNINNKIDSDISTAKNELERLINEKVDDVSTILARHIDGSINELIIDISTIKSDVDEFIAEQEREIGELRYDVSKLEDTLNASINNVKDTITEDVTNNLTTYINDTILNLIDTSIVKLDQDIHDLNDLININSNNIIQAEERLNNRINDIDGKIDTSFVNLETDVTNEINRQKQYLKDSINDLSTKFDAKLDSDKQELKNLINKTKTDIDASFITFRSEFESKLRTHQSDVSTSFENFKDDVNNSIKNVRTEIMTHFDVLIQEQMLPIKTEVESEIEEINKKLPVPGKGLTNQGNVISLVIDENGILSFGSRKFQLNEIL